MVDVPPGTSILEALLDRGYDVVDSRCEEGLCGICVLELVEGLPDHRDAVLSPEERSGGRKIAVCCLRSLTPVLKLRL